MAEPGGTAETPGRVPWWLWEPLRREPWVYTLYALVGVVFGAVYFVFALPLTVLAVVTIPFLFLGTPLLWATMGLARAFGNLERARLRWFTGVVVPASPLEGRTGVVRSMFWLLRSKDRWREVAYSLLRLPVSAVSAGLVVGGWGGGIASFIVALVRVFDDHVLLDGVILSMVGCALILTAPWLARGAMFVDTALVRLLLGPSEKEKLTEEVSTLRTSRAGVVDAADAERRRIERDLHDGAQQRLVALAVDLGVARARLDDDAGEGRRGEENAEAVRALVIKAHEESKAALAELRELVRGIHPAVLTDRGLDAALSALAARCTVPVDVEVWVEERADVAVEAAAYFVVAEALTNVSKHSRASRARVEVTREDDVMRVRVEDDGVGGAHTATGSGLAGLSRRVGALDGGFELTSPAGGPTVLVVELPCT